MNKLKNNQELWDLFTKNEEYNPAFLDQYQRFRYYLSKHRTVLIPEVSEFLVQNGLKIQYPEEKSFAVCLTHDIDVIGYSNLRTFYDAMHTLSKFQIRNAMKILRSIFNKNYNPLRKFTQIMNLEEKYEGKSTFFFLSLGKGELDFNYSLEKISDELFSIIDKGFEVGLHGGHNAYLNLKEIKSQKERLEKIIKKEVIGYRNHFMRFKVPTTWELLKTAGFKYDTTFGYPDCVGFRNGICYPFKPYNLNTDQYIDILEVPLTIMDGTLDLYMQLNTQNAWQIIKSIINVVKKNMGVLTILWHNTNLIDDRIKFYEKILRYCDENNAWLTSCEEIWKWWGENKFLEDFL
ncbi:MAG: polysaccharide deacetylase family protein [Candidatus Helarchaeota archaeon]